MEKDVEDVLKLLTKRFNDNKLYRGVGFEEAVESCKAGHLIYYSKEPMSIDWEVIEYSIGGDASEMSEEEINDWLNSVVYWRPITKGVNLTSDLENAGGYSNIVLEINPTGDYVEFSDVHYFAKEPNECIVVAVHHKGKKLSRETFLKRMDKL
jgi:hypothetical protein